ncbi:MAG: hypothetical protein KAG96_04680 [Ichthyobacteriaceae bacterium]|nr:hypothetical protein [Ichthyobacteriaceae bacterium]
MNKYIFNNTLRIAALLLFVAFGSCTDFSVEKPIVRSSEENATITIKELIDNYKNKVVDKDERIVGIVTGNNSEGNIYKIVYLQDETGFEGGNIKMLLQVDQPDFFAFGRPIVIRLKGFYVGENKSGISIYESFDETSESPVQISNLNIGANKSVNYKQGIKEVKPTVVKLNELGSKYLNAYIKIEDVQYKKKYINNDTIHFADGKDAEFGSSKRYIEECVTRDSIASHTLMYANFSIESIPVGKGSVTGNFTVNGSVNDKSSYQLWITRIEDNLVSNNEADRCD